MSCLNGTVLLINTKDYPFNNSKTTVALPSPLTSVEYIVTTCVVFSSGEVGEITVSDKTRNGFKIAYSGSASKAEIFWSIEVSA